MSRRLSEYDPEFLRAASRFLDKWGWAQAGAAAGMIVGIAYAKLSMPEWSYVVALTAMFVLSGAAGVGSLLFADAAGRAEGHP